MDLKVKNTEIVLETTAPIEQRVIRGVSSVGWILNLSIKTPLTSNEVEEIFNAENISELEFSIKSESGSESKYVINDYQKLYTATIKRGVDGSCTTDVQLIKEAVANA